MSNHSNWQLAQPDLETVFRRYSAPLEELALGNIPAIVLRRAYTPAACRALVERLIERNLLYDPKLPVPDKFLEEAIPEGYYREGRQQQAESWQQKTREGRRRIDVGTSLGYRGSNPDDFFAHSQQTHRLFADLFNGLEDPVSLCYDRLQQLSRSKRVLTAREPDGRQYGPAIIRAHYGGYTYRPHFDSVRLREKRGEYAVHEFEHQFAGVLVLQNAQREGRTAQCILHRCLWQPEVDVHLQAGTFHQYAREAGIEQTDVRLEPGDLYFFNTRLIHEVPGVDGELPRIVLATFIGYSAAREEIFVWS